MHLATNHLKAYILLVGVETQEIRPEVEMKVETCRSYYFLHLLSFGFQFTLFFGSPVRILCENRGSVD